MKIYTGHGDKGMTDLRDMTRVSKTSHRIEAYGTAGEANTLIGMVRPTGRDDMDDVPEAARNHLHIVQANLVDPGPNGGDPQIAVDHVDELEVWMDKADEELDLLTSFILPGESETGVKLHRVRVVSQRAERCAVSLTAEEPVNEEVVVYLNRLPDVPFVSA